MKRQNVRKLIIISSMLLFPITIYYFSPYVIIQGALEGVITGSFIVFCAMLLGGIFFGRLFCAYLCPAGGIQECATMIQEKAPKQGWKNYIKYVIWALWISGVIISFIFRSNEISVNFFYMTDHGISVANIYGYIVYYGIILLFFLPAVLVGKRTMCHYICWMAPFMVIGSKLGTLLHIKQLRLEGSKDKCVNCHACDKACPMSLKVSQKVQNGNMRDSECILCGACIDGCPKKAICYRMK
ncbi:MAG: 4Fe-4S binding domain/4Fe-4S dicluster [Firmicutes bacterium]|nr:4Fe-4S binding domain/4Fe-4S dicluster [Bacillota bacterium]